MSSVGQQIREQRLQLGLKLEEIAARTRIPLRTLQAIETDDLASISSPFLYKSFTRQFAQHVKLDYQQLAAGVDSAALALPQPRIPGEGNFGKTNLAPLPVKERSKNTRWLYSIASLGLMVVACSSVYGLWQTSKAGWASELGGFIHPKPAPSLTFSPAKHLPVTTPSGTIVALSAPPRKRAVAATPPTANQEEILAAVEPSTVAPVAPAAPESPDYRVELSAIERTWVSIVEDGKQTFSGMLDPEQTKVLAGHDTARIRTGNAGGINCVFNGKAIGPLGPRGQVRIVVFTKSNYEVLDAADHIALARFPSIAE